MDVIEKRCMACGLIKPLTEFYKAKTGKYGRLARCKLCHAEAIRHRLKIDPGFRKREHERRQRWTDKNPERVKQNALNWQRANPEKARAIHKKASAKARKKPEYKEYMNSYLVEWHKRNPGKKKQYSDKRKHVANKKFRVKWASDSEFREQNNKRAREWVKNNKERTATHKKTWRDKNRRKARAHLKLRRAIAAGTMTRPTECSACGKLCKPEGHHADYSRPLEVTWLCRQCHAGLHRKGASECKTVHAHNSLET